VNWGDVGRPMQLKGTTLMTSCLLIDENGAERLRLRSMLDGLGIETAQAAATEEALQFCNDNAPDVVMLSAAGAGGRPTDFVRRLRRKVQGKAPIVILYADTPDTEMIGRSIMQGAADVLMKPFDQDLLRFKLRQAGVIA
jgi:two-component system, chemotaxis family, chemotaxis protein CheY